MEDRIYHAVYLIAEIRISKLRFREVGSMLRNYNMDLKTVNVEIQVLYNDVVTGFVIEPVLADP